MSTVFDRLAARDRLHRGTVLRKFIGFEALEGRVQLCFHPRALFIRDVPHVIRC